MSRIARSTRPLPQERLNCIWSGQPAKLMDMCTVTAPQGTGADHLPGSVFYDTAAQALAVRYACEVSRDPLLTGGARTIGFPYIYPLGTCYSPWLVLITLGGASTIGKRWRVALFLDVRPSRFPLTAAHCIALPPSPRCRDGWVGFRSIQLPTRKPATARQFATGYGIAKDYPRYGSLGIESPRFCKELSPLKYRPMVLVRST